MKPQIREWGCEKNDGGWFGDKLEFGWRIGCIDGATIRVDGRAVVEPGTPEELLQKAGVGIPGEFTHGSSSRKSDQEETSHNAPDSEFACLGGGDLRADICCVRTGRSAGA